MIESEKGFKRGRRHPPGDPVPLHHDRDPLHASPRRGWRHRIANTAQRLAHV